MDDSPASLNWLTSTKSPFSIHTIINKPEVSTDFDQKLPIRPVSKDPAKCGRPNKSLAVMIYEAFKNCKCILTVSDISKSICNTYKYYRERKHFTINGTVRNALTKDKRFKKIPKSNALEKRHSYWKLACPEIWNQITKGRAPEVSSEADFKRVIAHYPVIEEKPQPIVTTISELEKMYNINPIQPQPQLIINYQKAPKQIPVQLPNMVYSKPPDIFTPVLYKNMCPDIFNKKIPMLTENDLSILPIDDDNDSEDSGLDMLNCDRFYEYEDGFRHPWEEDLRIDQDQEWIL